MTDHDTSDSCTGGSGRTVVATPYGKRFHRLKKGQRAKHAACGGFVQTNLFQIPESEALEQGYDRCKNCEWDTDSDHDGGDDG